jgi:NADH-quinone oxidoreductase subunit H
VEGPAAVEPASDYPVPPLDLVVPKPPRHRLRRPAGEALPRTESPTRPR